MALKHAILLVDDEPPILRLLQEGLGIYEDSFEVHVASSGREALKILSRRPIDLVATDLLMPEMDGFELIQEARRKDPGLRFIVMSAYATDEHTQLAKRSGALFFIEKPFTLDDFVDRLLDAFRPTPGFHATGLTGFHIGDALQLIHMGRGSNLITVRSEFQPDGVILIQEGMLVHAEIGDLVGEEAFFEILALEGGEIAAEPLDIEPRRTIERPLTELVLESMRVKDERAEELRKRRETQKELVVGEDAPPMSVASMDFYQMIDDGFEAYRRGDLKAARRFWEEAHELRPDDRAVLFNLRRLDQKERSS